jgi:thiamine pyrophosphokinase
VRHPASIARTLFPKLGRRAVVLCDGPPPPFAVLEHWLADADIFLCADAAGRPYARLPRPPDLVIGDFDALRRDDSAHIEQGPAGDRVDGLPALHVAEQESTDSEKALLWALKHFFAEGVLLGATGARLDHSFFNVSLVERFADRMSLCLADEYSVSIRLAPHSFTHWPLPAGTGFSLIPLASPVSEVNLAGAAYPLHDARLVPGGPATVSNRVVDPPLSVRVGQGSLLLSVSLLRDRDQRWS